MQGDPGKMPALAGTRMTRAPLPASPSLQEEVGADAADGFFDDFNRKKDQPRRKPARVPMDLEEDRDSDSEDLDNQIEEDSRRTRTFPANTGDQGAVEGSEKPKAGAVLMF